MEENCWIMERILQFADSKTTGERWIFFSENVRKCVNNAAFSNIHNLFSERVNTTFFAVLEMRLSRLRRLTYTASAFLQTVAYDCMSSLEI